MLERGLCARNFSPGCRRFPHELHALRASAFGISLVNLGAYDDDRMMQLWWSLFLVWDFIFSADGGTWIWSSAIALLTALAIFIVARSFYRSRRLQPTQC
jgi:hypothetical protein